MICKDIQAASREGFVIESQLEHQRHRRLTQAGTRQPGKHRVHYHGLTLQRRGLVADNSFPVWPSSMQWLPSLANGDYLDVQLTVWQATYL